MKKYYYIPLSNVSSENILVLFVENYRVPTFKQMELPGTIDFIGLVLLRLKHANLIEKSSRVKSNGVGLAKKLRNQINLFCKELLYAFVTVHK
jgi:hypothetical protein